MNNKQFIKFYYNHLSTYRELYGLVRNQLNNLDISYMKEGIAIISINRKLQQELTNMARDLADTSPEPVISVTLSSYMSTDATMREDFKVDYLYSDLAPLVRKSKGERTTHTFKTNIYITV